MFGCGGSQPELSPRAVNGLESAFVSARSGTLLSLDIGTRDLRINSLCRRNVISMLHQLLAASAQLP
jgi:hypothetical protein